MKKSKTILYKTITHKMSLQPNLHPVPHKSTKQHTSFTPHKSKKKPKKPDRALTCKHHRLIDETYGEVYCPKCFAIHDSWFVHEPDMKNKNSNLIIWNREYDKSRWTGYSLDMMLGKNSHELTDQCWLEIIRDIPDPFRWYDVYKVFQKYYLLKYWVAFGDFIGLRPKLNQNIMNHFATYMEIGHGKYSISYYFLLYKFTQLFGEPGDEERIPLKNSAAWCRKTDIWWEQICDQHGWIFHETVQHKITWNKQEFLSKFAKCVKKYIQDSLTYST